MHVQLSGTGCIIYTLVASCSFSPPLATHPFRKATLIWTVSSFILYNTATLFLQGFLSSNCVLGASCYTSCLEAFPQAIPAARSSIPDVYLCSFTLDLSQ